MFGDKKSKTESTNSSGGHAANVIQHGTIITGQVFSKGNIRVDGKIEGTLKTDAKLVVGRTGEIKGDIVCKSASVEGKITGTIQVDGLLSLRGAAHVEGDVVTKKLAIEEGAVFEAKCSMAAKVQSANITSNASQKQAG